MSKLRLLQHTECCPDKWRFTVPQSGHTVRCFSWDGLLTQIKDYCRDNGFPVPTVEDVEHQLCQILPPGWCAYEDGSAPAWYLDARISLDDVINGTKALGALMAAAIAAAFGGEKPTVSQELAESRASTCARCYMNVNIPGCLPCVGFANIVAEVASGITTPADPFLKACLVCKCANEAQTRVKAEILSNGVPDEMLPKFPEFCWKKIEIEKLRGSATA